MHKALPLLITAALSLAACSKSSNPSASAANPTDPVEKKLQEIAGSGAANCGHLKAQVAAEMDVAGKCVMRAAQQKKPFYVAYDLPGMTVAMAGTAEGKLFSVQTQPSAPGGLASVPCPAELRIAPSGRVTCYAPGTFPMGMDATHGTMTMPPATGSNPHKGLGGPPAGGTNPHQPQSSKPPAKQL